MWRSENQGIQVGPSFSPLSTRPPKREIMLCVMRDWWLFWARESPNSLPRSYSPSTLGEVSFSSVTGGKKIFNSPNVFRGEDPKKLLLLSLKFPQSKGCISSKLKGIRLSTWKSWDSWTRIRLRKKREIVFGSKHTLEFESLERVLRDSKDRSNPKRIVESTW